MQVWGMSGDRPTISQFLLARIEDVERLARAAVTPLEPGTWHQGVEPASDPYELYASGDLNSPARCPEHPPGLPNLCDGNRIAAADDDFTKNGAAIIAHIAHHDPHTVLAECAAKRRIVADYQAATQNDTTDWAERDDNKITATALSRVVAGFAAVHSDHPDYRADEWGLE